jgi:hypothetical protein
MRCPLKWVGLAMALLGILVVGSVNYAQLDRNKGVEAARFTIDGKETVRLKIYATLAEGKQIKVTIGQNEITFTWTAENAKDGLDTGYLEISGSEVLVQLLDVGAPNRCQIPVREIPKVEKWEDRRPFCQARPAYFTVTDLFISPSSPQVNQSVTIRAIIRNTGEEAGTKTVTLYIDGSLKDSRSLTLNAGQSDTVSFSYTFSSSGTYTVKVSTPDDSRSVSVSVQARPNPPMADFSCSPTQGRPPLTVRCSDRSSGEITSWLWDWGDGTTSSERNPSHTYTRSGRYQITLTVRGPGGESRKPFCCIEVLQTGDVKVTLIWSSKADLDLYVVDPNGCIVYFDNPTCPSGGRLDVDANANCEENVTTSPVENIFWPPGQAPRGEYKVFVHYYARCSGASSTESFTVRVLVDGTEQVFSGTIRVDELKLITTFRR